MTANGYTGNPPGGGGGGGSTAWADITGKPTTFPPSAHTQAASTISDSTTVGRAVLTAADAAAGRTAIGAETSGTMTAHLAAGDPHAQYLTAAEGNAAYSALGHTHGQSDITNLAADLAAKAPLASPALTGNPTAPTQTAGNNSTRLATTAFVAAAVLAGGGGGGGSMVVRRSTVTSGNLTLGASTPWIPVPSGPSLVIPAVAGDYVEFEILGALGNLSVNFLDMAVLVGGSLVRFYSSGTATAASEGAPAFYGDQSFERWGPTFEFVVQAGDLDGGNVTVVLATKGSGGGTVYASTDYPFRWRAINYGAVTVS